MHLSYSYHYHRHKCWLIFSSLKNLFTYDRHWWLWLVSIHQDHFHYVWITDKSDFRSVAYGSFSDMKEDENGKMKNWTDKVVWKVSDVQSLNSLLNFMISSQKRCGLEDTAYTQQMISKYTSLEKYKVFSPWNILNVLR